MQSEPQAHGELRSDLVREMSRRGLLNQCTDIAALDGALATGRLVGYIGFDCTAPSLHAGSLVPIGLLRLLQQCGHKPIVVLGGGTSRVGDPSDKDDMRPLLSDAEIASNMAGIRAVIERFVRVGDGPCDAVFVNNADWLDELSYVGFLRDVGRHFTINRMLAFDSVRRRLDREQPMTFLEFNYMVLQAYDFVEVARRYDCRLQLGGSDQWGNIVNGVELARRLLEREVFGVTAPLLASASGTKMGKTAAGAVWLDADRTSPYDFWQYWRNVDDADAARLLRLLSEMPEEELRRLERLEGVEVNEAKKALAGALTRMCHGDEAAIRAEASARETFERGGLGTDLPRIEVSRAELQEGVSVAELMRRAGLCSSGGEARRLAECGGAYVNDVAVRDARQLVTLSDLDAGGIVKLSSGKKRHALVAVTR